MSDAEPGWLKKQVESACRDTAAIGGSWEPGDIVQHCIELDYKLDLAQAEIAAVTSERDALRNVLRKVSMIHIHAWDEAEEASKNTFWEGRANEAANLALDAITKLESGELRL